MSEALTKEQTRQRVQELFDLASQRHLAAGGDSHRSASCNYYLNLEEQQELRTWLSFTVSTWAIQDIRVIPTTAQ